MSTPAPSATFRALRHREFRLFFTGAFVSNIGTWMQGVAQGWLVLQLGGSAGWLGTIGFLSTLPALLFMPLAGVVADRADRRRLMIVLQTVMMLCAACLGALVLLGRVALWQLCGLTLISGAALAFNGPSFSATIRDLTGREDLQSGVGLIASQFHLSRAFGPLCAAGLIAVVGVAGCFLLNAASFLAVIAALLAIAPRPRPAPERPASLAVVQEDIKAGLRYAAGEPVTRWLLLFTAFTSLLGLPLITLLPVLADKTFHAGARGLGYLSAAHGSGALLGALLSARSGVRLGFRRAAALGGLLFGLGIVLLSQAPNLEVALGLQAVIGFAQVLASAIGMATVQSTVPDDMRGRVMSLYSVSFVGPSTLGTLAAGWIAHSIGVPHTLLGCGALLFVVVSVLLSVAPQQKAA